MFPFDRFAVVLDAFTMVPMLVRDVLLTLAAHMDSFSNRAIAIRWVASAVVCCLGMGLPVSGRSQTMAEQIPHRIVPSPAQSELQQLAEWFHQDWKLVFPDFYAGLNLYLDNLCADRRVVLGRELCQFVEQNEGTSPDELKRLWLGLGAQGWQASLDIHSTLEEFCRIVDRRG